MQENTNLSTSIWEITTQQITKHIQDGSCIRDFPDVSCFLFSGMDCWWEIAVHWHNCGCVFKYNNDWYDKQLHIECFSLFREMERVSVENYFEVSSSWALQSQFGGPRRLLSSWVSLSSLPWTCSAPTLWAVSMAVMSRWAYLMEPSSGRQSAGEGEKRENVCISTLFCVF